MVCYFTYNKKLQTPKKKIATKYFTEFDKSQKTLSEKNQWAMDQKLLQSLYQYL